MAEAAAINVFAGAASDPMIAALEVIHRSTGPLIVSGIGKSGHIARKIASTFCSIGKPAIFLHPADASHGDLGLVHPGSAVMILSCFGATTELSDLIHYCRAHGNPIISLSFSADSTLARNAEVAIVYGRLAEVCPTGWPPPRRPR